MAIYAVRYTYTDDLDALAEIRPAHREFLKSLFDQGNLLASGPLEGNGALLIVDSDDAVGALAVVDADPFNSACLIADREVLEWTQIYGPWA
ncbi:YciI family protein [Trueperella pyogenes]|uniref:YciI family protein n=1 Tax=Trueperella pyogenes TaxID=1661 RepID=UPI00215BC5A2|nr:YciI family protein [Trueperella pyogenes]UVJ58776.1 YciI family protein [Trueperella pyogenes]